MATGFLLSAHSGQPVIRRFLSGGPATILLEPGVLPEQKESAVSITANETGALPHQIRDTRLCNFRRHTIIRGDSKESPVVAVATYGMERNIGQDGLCNFVPLKPGLYYETVAFMPEEKDCPKLSLGVSVGVSELEMDSFANELHDQAVREVMRLVDAGQIVRPKPDTFESMPDGSTAYAW